MKILIIGDTHFHNWAIKQLNNYQERFLGEILPKTIKEHRPDIIVFLGDFFESKNTVDKKVLGSVISSLEKISKHVMRIFVVVGNHDYYSLSEGPAIDFLSTITTLTIVKEPFVYENSLNLGFIPWAAEIDKEIIEDIISRSSVSFSHIDIKGIPYNPNLKNMASKGGIGAEVLSGSPIFNGHYHVPQEFGNVINVGSISQMEVSEIGSKKRMILYDTLTQSYSNIYLPHPVYVLVENTADFNKMMENEDPMVIPYLNIVEEKAKKTVGVVKDGKIETEEREEEAPKDIISITLDSLKEIYEMLDENKKKLVSYRELEEMVITSYAERRNQK